MTDRAPEGLIGRSLLRQEDPRLLRGKGQYVADVAPPGLLHLAVVRSPPAHARILGIDARVLEDDAHRRESRPST